MKVTLKLYAILSDYLPGDASEHATRVEISGSTTPYDLIDRYKVPREQAHLVLLNGVYVEPADRDKPGLNDGDTLAIWPPVAGG